MTIAELAVAVLLLAQVHPVAARCQGEAEVLGYEGVRLCACTVRNRLDSEYFPDDLSVLAAYFAPDKGPADWAVEATEEAFAGDCEPVVYLYSAQDVRKLGLDPHRAVVVLRNGPWALHGY